jgi:transcriptional regulator with XRE-family HTH domain
MENLSLMTDKEILIILAAKAKFLRLQKNFRQSDLAQKSGLSLPTIRAFETTGVISFLNLIKISRALGTIETLYALFPPLPMVDIEQMIAAEHNQRKRARK